jgi:hypothetical protein
MGTSFVRGQNPKDAMELGASGIVKRWMETNNTAKASITTMLEGDVVKINVNGDVVLRAFDIADAQGIRGKFKVEFGDITGCKTILINLSPEEIYVRIKKFYKMILDNCLGKSYEEQQRYLAQIDKDAINPNNPYPLKPGAIEKMNEYIQGLPENPTIQQISELLEQVTSGCLESLSQIKNERSVTMKQYAESFEKRS